MTDGTSCRTVYSHLHRPPVPASYNRSIFQTCSRLLARSIFQPNLASLFDCSLLDSPLDFRPSHLVLIGFQNQGFSFCSRETVFLMWEMLDVPSAKKTIKPAINLNLWKSLFPVALVDTIGHVAASNLDIISEKCI
ncbi:hypothetical protein L1987_80235 [Smallanthus sonchifolius]|uniref:Uncharacterized protein n=1 Tax=Smallanthus sonchifolius TaxID=185202 RepID=A0ACB8YM59_9ASTR|nr:hypothetical protein L1987_80235 [Smallanthus sonchifolius]